MIRQFTPNITQVQTLNKSFAWPLLYREVQPAVGDDEKKSANQLNNPWLIYCAGIIMWSMWRGSIVFNKWSKCIFMFSHCCIADIHQCKCSPLMMHKNLWIRGIRTLSPSSRDVEQTSFPVEMILFLTELSLSWSKFFGYPPSAPKFICYLNNLPLPVVKILNGKIADIRQNAST